MGKYSTSLFALLIIDALPGCPFCLVVLYVYSMVLDVFCFFSRFVSFDEI